ncbi:MAG: DUF3634 family protein [Deltaproteobacteria bacterium]|nr:DUF3634 family protein [Deltaproteobacteria bacterium]
MPLVILLGGLLALLFFFVVVPRMNELFLISVREGKLLIVRGRVPVRVRQDLADVVRRAGVRRASIRAVRESGHARLSTSGIDEGTTQRLRNAFGTHPVQRLQSAPLLRKRNLGQILGFAWLAWLLSGRSR